MRHAVAFLSGVLFAAGLCLAGMTSPDKIIGFLDVRHWDPTLLFTMMGAVPVMFVGWRVRARMARPLAGASFPAAPPARLDARLVAGATLFGIGWGLGGFCPGPILVSVGGGVRAALVLLPSMAAGMLLHRLAFERTPAPVVGEEKLPA